MKCKNFLCINYDENEYGNCIHDRNWGWELSECDKRKTFNRIEKAKMGRDPYQWTMKDRWNEEKEKAKGGE